MRNINYREDFVLLIQLLNHKGEPVGVPDVDFSIRFYSGHTVYTVGCQDGEFIRCAPMDDGRLRVIFDNHGLSPVKELVGHATYRIPDSLMPDGIRDLPQTIHTGVCLTVGPSDRPSEAEVSVMLPFIKGEPGSLADLSPEERESFIREIIDSIPTEISGCEPIPPEEIDELWNAADITDQP